MNQTIPRLAHSTGSMLVSPFNPYQAPAADDAPPSAEGDGTSRGATRGQRLLAAIVDSVVALVLLLPLQLYFGVYRNFPKIVPLSFGATVVWAAVSLAVWFVLHGYFLAKNGQTIGKRIVGIRVEDRAYVRPAQLWKLTLVRYLPIAALVLIPKVGPVFSLIDTLFIFRRDRRCLHDHIADTVVVRV
jgi:uncharacterized RDD family membrane protein YckC